MEIRVKGSQVRFIYNDGLSGLMEHGKSNTKRASHVEPNENGEWTADLTPVSGPILGPFKYRKDALDAEVNWLTNSKIPTPK